jgi:hypothetical protein
MFDSIAAALYAVGLRLTCLASLHQAAEKRPLLVGIGVLIVSGVLYLPVLANFGDHWVPLVTRPFYFELPRIGLYLTWFAFGVVIGTGSATQGLLSDNGALVRDWKACIALCFTIFNLLVFAPRLLTAANLLTAYQRDAIQAILWVSSCTASCFGFLALYRGVVHTRRAWMDSLTRSAYIIYIVHWLFVLWMQRAFLDIQLHAGIKAIAVFFGALTLSWLTAQALLVVPVARRIL